MAVARAGKRVAAPLSVAPLPALRSRCLRSASWLPCFGIAVGAFTSKAVVNLAGVGLPQAAATRGRLFALPFLMAAPLATEAVAPAQAIDAKALGALWASAYEGWVSPAGASQDEVVYLTPAQGIAETISLASAEQCSASWSPWVEACLKLADQHGGLFGITAFNPMGQDKPHKENLEKNLELEKDVKQLCADTGGTWWRSFGFAGDWHEKGFTVAGPQDRIVELAKKYNQGAVFRFYRFSSSSGCKTPFMRTTVPAALPDTEADVPMEPCSRPEIKRADPQWALDV